MSTSKTEKPIVQPMIDELVKPGQPKNSGTPAPALPRQPAELDQDAGGGYNSNHTYPQT